ncbi:uncharacterized protein LOC110888093 [Helianthus annuus]|uniref:uncharacterized protein LOC110888093 n=1 Tax=Helianthus annuus TaxID=4232 RepID=UPI000B902B80|nr:uncharacterized protein LOC110888093 [Helianthus annuus]
MDPVSTSITLISKLDIGSRLYLHPSDSSALTIGSIKLKGTENYIVWASVMKLALEAKNKYGFMDGKCEKPEDDDVLSAQWDRCNSVVLTWLLNFVSEELLLGQVFSKLASEVWVDLKESFDKVDGSVVCDLYKKINCISQNGSSVAEYYNKLTTMWKQFDTMLQLPSCSCKAAKEYNDFTTLFKLIQFLIDLDYVYQPVRTKQITKLLHLVGEKSGSESHASNVGDSSGNQHMTKTDKNMYNCVDVLEFDLSISHPNGTSVKVLKIGDLRLIDGVVLKDVFYVSDYCVNLLSVHKLAKDNNSSVVFNEENYVLQDSKSRKVLMIGSQDSGLYFVGQNGNYDGVCFNSVLKTYLWHSRLGHPLDQVLALLKHEIGINSLDHGPCEICHKAKQVTVPFPISEHKSKCVGDLVHLDLWGPYKVSSYEGFKYF